jgi:hypothetical protein
MDLSVVHITAVDNIVDFMCDVISPFWGQRGDREGFPSIFLGLWKKLVSNHAKNVPILIMKSEDPFVTKVWFRSRCITV